MKKKLFENVGGNQFKLAPENESEAWRKTEPPTDPTESDPLDAREDEGIWGAISDVESNLVDYAEELKDAKSKNDDERFYGTFDKLSDRFYKSLVSLDDRIRKSNDIQAKNKMKELWVQYEKIMEV